MNEEPWRPGSSRTPSTPAGVGRRGAPPEGALPLVRLGLHYLSYIKEKFGSSRRRWHYFQFHPHHFLKLTRAPPREFPAPILSSSQISSGLPTWAPPHRSRSPALLSLDLPKLPPLSLDRFSPSNSLPRRNPRAIPAPLSRIAHRCWRSASLSYPAPPSSPLSRRLYIPTPPLPPPYFRWLAQSSTSAASSSASISQSSSPPPGLSADSVCSSGTAVRGGNGGLNTAARSSEVISLGQNPQYLFGCRAIPRYFFKPMVAKEPFPEWLEQNLVPLQVKFHCSADKVLLLHDGVKSE